MERERLRLESACLRTLERLATRAVEEGDWEAAAAWWERATIRDPLDSRIAAGAARALRKGGHPAAARRLTAAHLALLREEFGTEAVREAKEVLGGGP
jgi:DNA-binding SARP family transcriptional activator